MLPLSLGRTPSLGADHRNLHESLAWFRPANIAASSSADFRARVRWLAVFVAVGVLIALGHVWLRLKVVDVGYRLSSTRQVINRLEQEGHELTVDVAALDAPGRLEQAARTRLGMAHPEKVVEAVLP